MSPCVGGHWGTYWGSLCFRGRNHLRQGLIRRLFLVDLHVQLIRERLRHKRHVICAGSCQCGYVM
jgi:hypothetical protein